MKKVSIIVPVYNVELYLEKCVESLICQTYPNIEIILINDGSTDSSSKICDKLSKNNSKIKVIHKKNEGVSSARNLGLNVCTGEYITFVDSDDYINNNYIETLLKSIIENNTDLSVCGYQKVYSHENFTTDNCDDLGVKIYSKSDAFNQMILEQQFGGYVWNKMYKKELIDLMNNQYFKEDIIEDFEFNSRYISNCKSISFIKSSLYYYFINQNGITGSFKINDRILSGIKSYTSILEQYDLNKIYFADLVAYYFVKYQLNLNYRIYKLNYNCDTSILNYKLYKRVIKSKIITLGKKIELFLLWHFPIILYSIKFQLKGVMKK